MTWFVDASVMVALVAREQDWERLAILMDLEPDRIWSPLARWEGVAGARLRLNVPVESARIRIDELAATHRFTMVGIGEREADLALDAYRLLGKGSGHRAQLNMGDYFAYACTKAQGARLLYKGADFSHTDLAL